MDEQHTESSLEDSKLQAGRGVPSEKENSAVQPVERRTRKSKDTMLADRIRKAGA